MNPGIEAETVGKALEDALAEAVSAQRRQLTNTRRPQTEQVWPIMRLKVTSNGNLALCHRYLVSYPSLVNLWTLSKLIASHSSSILSRFDHRQQSTRDFHQVTSKWQVPIVKDPKVHKACLCYSLAEVVLNLTISEQAAELGTASAVVGLLETAISLVRTIQSSRRQVKELPKTLLDTATQLEGLVQSLSLVKSEPTLQTASVMLQVEAIIDVAEELRDLLGTLRKRQEKSSGRQMMHAITSGDEDEKQITSIVRRVGSARAELTLRIVVAQVGLIRTLNDGFRVASLTLAEVNDKVSSSLGTNLVLADMTRGRVPDADGTVALLQEEVTSLGLNEQPQPYDAPGSDMKGQNIPEHNSMVYGNITLDQARIMTGDVGVEKWQNISRVNEVAFNKFGKDTRVMTGNVGPGAASAFMENFWK